MKSPLKFETPDHLIGNLDKADLKFINKYYHPFLIAPTKDNKYVIVANNDGGLYDDTTTYFYLLDEDLKIIADSSTTQDWPKIEKYFPRQFWSSEKFEDNDL